MTGPTLDVLRAMLQQVLDTQSEIREDLLEIRRCLDRLEARSAQIRLFMKTRCMRYGPGPAIWPG
jgi:hypothetical protein